MIKIPCLYERDFTNKRRPVLLRTMTPGCEWVLSKDTRATIKRDGTACLVREGKLWKRYDVKVKYGKMVPIGAIPCTPAADGVTGHWPHWVEVGSEPDSKWHREAWTGLRASDGSRFRPTWSAKDGTYELCGPAIGGNAERLTEHVFFRHGSEACDLDLTYLVERSLTGMVWEAIHNWLDSHTYEGIVFHGANGEMCKIRRDDYGLAWPIKSE